MGFKNHELFIKRHKNLFQGPILEIGSRDYGSTVNMRDLFPGEEYIGIDMQAGKGVDHVIDLTAPLEGIDAILDRRRFGTIICLSVLEHCAQPFRMAENITRLLRPGGRLYVSVPFSWKFHGYPSDYWRFTHEGVKQLFPELVFDMASSCTSTDVAGDLHPVDEELRRFRLKGSWQRRRGALMRSIGADLVALLGALGPLRWLTRHRYLMPPTCIEMIGTLPQSAGRSGPA